MNNSQYWFSTAAGGDLGDEITQSLRFNSNGYLYRNQITPNLSSDRTFTFSTWFKHGDMGETNIFGIHPTSGNDNWILSFANFSNPSFAGRDAGSGWGQYSSGATFKDPNAWYHLFVTCSSGVLSLRVNNVLQNQTDTQNHSMDRGFYIGSEGGGGSAMDGYLAETYFIQGTVMDAVNDGFIRLNEDGVYVPDTPTISSYGTNGFYLKYDSDGVAGGTGDGAGIGADHSGNENHFSALGFDTAAISSTNRLSDVDYLDTPTSNYALFNNLWYRTTPNVKGANMELATSTTIAGQANFRFPVGTTGKYWVEAGTASYGATTNPPALLLTSELDAAGLSNTAWSTAANYSGLGGHFNAYYTNFNSTTANSFTMSTGQVALGINFDDQEVLMYHGGTLINTDTTVDFTKELALNVQQPDTGYNTYDPYLNSGQQTYIQTPPTGYKALQTNNLPEPTIKNGSEHCRVLTGTGANIFGIATGTNTNGTNWNSEVNTGFTNGLYWIKDISVANEWQVIDTVRGTSNVLQCPTNANETTYTAPGNTSIAYCWKAEDAWSSTDADVTAGTIASSGRRDLDAGFSIVSYTGNNTSNSTIGHGLTEAPDFIITRARNDTGGYWTFYHSSFGNGYGYMNYNLAYQVGSSMYQGRSNTTWTLDNNNNVNNSQAYISYVWHSVPGYSKFGTYESNTVADGPFVYLGFRPALVLIKNGDSTNQWQWINSTRDPQNSNNMHTLTPQTTAYEATGNAIELLSNGFKVRSGSGNFNYGGTFLYCAWAENPFGGENTPPVTAR